MDYFYKGYRFTKERSKICVKDVKALLDQAYFAHGRPQETIQRSMEHSLCFGVFDADDMLVGFARMLTDYAVTYYITDVVIEESHRNHSLGTHLIKYMLECEEVRGMKGVLLTSYAHSFYEKLGFVHDAQKCMIHQPNAQMHIVEEDET